MSTEISEISQIPTFQIKPGNNDRVIFNQAKLEELAASIAAHGLAQPITVRPLLTCTRCDYTGPHQEDERCPSCGGVDWVNGQYQIVAGERRFRAISQILKWDTAPCIVRPLGDEEASAIMLAENTGRADLNPIEEANAYASRAQRFGWNNDQIAKAAGVSSDLVKRRRGLLSLISDVQHLVAGGHLPIGHAEAMTGLDKGRQLIALRIYRESKNGLPLTQFN